jgi:hypothetical protein
VLGLLLGWTGNTRADTRHLYVFEDNEVLVFLDDTWVIPVNEDNMVFLLVFKGGLGGGIRVPRRVSENGSSEGQRGDGRRWGFERILKGTS